MVFGESYPPSKGELPTEHLICEQETEGNQIKVTQVNNLAGLLQPCNLRLYGKCKYQVENLNFKKKLVYTTSSPPVLTRDFIFENHKYVPS